MSREAQLAGITPLVLRTANHYSMLGVGTYLPKGYASFDRVEVRVKEPFEMDSSYISHSCSVLVVEFWQGEQLERSVDFVVAVAGFSGRPIMASVPSPPKKR